MILNRLRQVRVAQQQDDAAFASQKEIDAYLLEGNKEPRAQQPSTEGIISHEDLDEQDTQVGEQLLRESKVAVLALNGGLATRFGGVIKALFKIITLTI